MKNQNNEKTLLFFTYVVGFILLALVTFCLIGEKEDKPQKVEIVNTQKGGNGAK